LQSVGAKTGSAEQQHQTLPISECAHHRWRDQLKVTRRRRACQWGFTRAAANPPCAATEATPDRRIVIGKVNTASLLARCLHRGFGQWRGMVRMYRFLGRYRFKAGFVLRRIDRAAGNVNAFLLAAALGLGMLDLAYTIDKIVATLPPR